MINLSYGKFILLSHV